MVSRALSSGIIGGGGPAGLGSGAGVDVGVAIGRNCWLILLLLSLSWFRKRRNQPLERFDFLSSVMVLAVRLGGLEVMMFWGGAAAGARGGPEEAVDTCSS